MKNQPKYALHKPSGNARVTVYGKRIYLGKYNSPESIAKYNSVIAELESKQAGNSTITIGRLAILFMAHAEVYYRKPDGTPTNEATNFRHALKTVCREFPNLPVRNFGPMKLQQARDAMVKDGLARRTVNSWVRRLRQVIKWAVSQELCTGAVLQGLKSVEALKIGKTQARETDHVGPVSVDRVEAIRPFVSRPVWAAIQFMLFTGARPGEAITAKWSEINTKGKVWICTPSQHKTKHKGKGRQIVIGPQCQQVLNGIRELTRSDFVFDPQVAMDEFSRRAYGDHAKARRVGSHYSTFSLGTAIRTACEKAFGCPEELTVKATLRPMSNESAKAFVSRRKRAAAWRKEHCWHPNQLRHTKATQVREQADLETAQIILGHSSKTTTERYYAELDISRALQQAQQFG